MLCRNFPLMIVWVFFLIGSCGCESTVVPTQVGNNVNSASPPVESPEPPQADWSSDRIAKDPEGYCLYAASLLSTEVAAAELKLADALEKRTALVAKKDEFDRNLNDVSNLLKRCRRAYEKASEESQWPAKFSGRSFSEAELKKAIVSQARYVEARTRLKDQYATTLRNFDERVDRLQRNLEQLKDQEERLGLEYERIKIAKEDVDEKDLQGLASDIAGTVESLFNEESDVFSIDDLVEANQTKQDEGDFLKGE